MDRRQEEPEAKAPEVLVSKGSRLVAALNQPLAVTVISGALLFFITSYIQQRYWLAQQNYLFQQQSLQTKLTVVDEYVKSVDELLSAEAAEFTAYESSFKAPQMRGIDDELDAAEKHWDQQSDLQTLKIQVYFPGKPTKDALDQVSSDLAALDCYMMRLGTREVPRGFGCEELKVANLSQKEIIAKGRPIIDKAQGDLLALSRLMVASASGSH